MKRSFSHIYFVPTNRPISHSLNSYIAEIRHGLESLKLHDQLLLCVIEDGDEKNEAFNSRFMVEFARQLPEGMVKYVNRGLRKKLVNSVLPGQAGLQSLFLGKLLNYGRVANLTSIIAEYFSAQYVHRRDSDTGLQVESERKVFPIDFEVEYLNNKERGGCLVGGSYIGESNLDLFIFQDDRPLIKDFFSCMKIRPEAHDIIIETWLGKKSGQQSSPPQIRIVEGAHPDMGNVAYTREVYRNLPFPPHDDTTGTDYFPMITLLKAGRKVFLHNHDVVHRYMEDRSSEPFVVDYFTRVAKFIDYLQLYEDVFVRASHWCQGNTLVELGKMLENALCRGSAKTNLRVNSLQGFIAIMRRTHVSFSKRLADQIEEKMQTILDFGLVGLQDHLSLVQNWQNIMLRAKQSNALEINDNAVL